MQAQIMQMKAQLAQNSNYVMDSPRNNNNATTSPYSSWQENNHNCTTCTTTTTTTGTVPSAEWGAAVPAVATNYCYSFNPPPNTVSPQSSPESVDYSGRGGGRAAPEDYYNYLTQQNIKYRDQEAPALMFGQPKTARKRPYNNELGDLQALALKMMGN